MASPRRVLSPSASRALPLIEGAAARGLSANAIGSLLAEQGLGVRRADLLEAVRFVRDKEAAADRLKFVRPGLRPDPERIPQSLHPRIMLRDFSYTVEVRGSGPGFDAEGRLFVNIAADQSLTRAEIEAEAEDAVLNGEAERYAGAAIAGIVLTAAVRR